MDKNAACVKLISAKPALQADSVKSIQTGVLHHMH